MPLFRASLNTERQPIAVHTCMPTKVELNSRRLNLKQYNSPQVKLLGHVGGGEVPWSRFRSSYNIGGVKCWRICDTIVTVEIRAV